MSKSIISSIVTVLMVFIGIFMLIKFCPTDDFDPVLLGFEHKIKILLFFVLSFIVAYLFCKAIFTSLMLGLGGLFMFFGLFFMLNGVLDQSPIDAHYYKVIEKNKEYMDNATNPGAWNYYLRGIDEETNKTFKFSTYVNHISKDDYDRVDLDGSSAWILQYNRKGFFKLPWREIKGVVFENKN